MGRDGVRSDAIESVEVHTFARALKLNNETDPGTLEGAQYSVPFCLGVVACNGPKAMLPLTAARGLPVADVLDGIATFDDGDYRPLIRALAALEV